jgi:hypothetical protein
MKIDKINAPMRVFILVVASVLFIGIWLTGFATAHWLLYIPVIFLTLAAITGVCLGMNLSNKLFGKHSKDAD